MRRWLMGTLLAMACTGQPQTPAPDPFPPAPATERRAAPAADLPLSVAINPVPDGLNEIRFDASGLRTISPSGQSAVIAAAVPDFVDGKIMPEGMSRYGRSHPAVARWAQRTLNPTAPIEVVVAVPAGTRYAVLKSLLQPLFEFGGARVAHLVVRDRDGAERALRLPYPELYPPGTPPPPTLSITVDLEGLRLTGLGNTTPGGQRKLPCEGGCAGRETYALDAAARTAYRAHARLNADHLMLIPHSDVPVDVIVAVLDYTRDDRSFNNKGEVMFPNQMLAGSRTYLPTTADQQAAIRARAGQDASAPDTDSTPAPD